MSEITVSMMIWEVEAEIVRRRTAYAGSVARGRMKQSDARHHLETMQAVLRLLQELRDKEIREQKAAISDAVSMGPQTED
jgi:hypothetical protein